MTVLLKLTSAERDAVDEFLRGVRSRLASDLEEARLFGSRARGEGNAASDVDLALVVTAAGRARRREVYDLAFDVGLKYGVQIAPLVIEREKLEELRKRERRLAADIDREGIPL